MFAVSASYAGSDQAKGKVCQNKYALCTSAPCIPDPNDPDKRAICKCDVEKGDNFGMTDCDARQPKTLKDDGQYVVSTYSFKQAPEKKVLLCDSGNPWTDCLDQPCIVDPNNPDKAICSCKLHTTGEFYTYGGNCDKSTCKTSYWSAASKEGFTDGSAALVKALKLDKSPAQACPAN